VPSMTTSRKSYFENVKKSPSTEIWGCVFNPQPCLQFSTPDCKKYIMVNYMWFEWVNKVYEIQLERCHTIWAKITQLLYAHTNCYRNCLIKTGIYWKSNVPFLTKCLNKSHNLPILQQQLLYAHTKCIRNCLIKNGIY